MVRIGEFAWAEMEPTEGRLDWEWLDGAISILADYNLKVVLGTPTATPPPWLTTAHPEVLPRDEHRRVSHAGSRRHYCPNSPVYQDYTRKIVTAMAKRYGDDARVIGWQTDNEFGCHDTGRCYCDVCLRRFRAWLQERYGSLDALNEAWGSVFWSALYSDWNEIPLPRAAPAEHNPSHVLDFHRFSSDSWRDYQQLQIDALRERISDRFITHNFTLFSSREVDGYDLAAPLDPVSWDNYHFHGTTPSILAAIHDVRWAMKSRNYWVMEQQVSNVTWAPYNPTFRPGEVGLKVWQGVPPGADGMVYFRWRAARLGAELYHSGLLNHGVRPTRGYAEASEIGQTLNKLVPMLEGSVPQAEVDLLQGYASRWSFDLQPHNRDSRDDEAFRRALMGPCEALWVRNVPVHILPACSDSDLSGYKAVIAPALNLLSSKGAEWLAAYVRHGGTLVVTARTGFKDERGQVPGPPPGHLPELMGVTAEEFDSLPPGRVNHVRFVEGATGSAPVSPWFEVLDPGAARSVAVYEDDYYAGRPAVTMRELGQGRAIYVGVLAGSDLYSLLLDWLLPLLDVGAALETRDGVEAMARVGPAGKVLFLLNHNRAPATVTLLEGTIDALTKEPMARQLELGPRDVRISTVGMDG